MDQQQNRCTSSVPAFAVVMVGRLLQALAAGLVMPIAFTITLLEFPKSRRGGAMGIIMLVVGFAPGVGPTVSGVIVGAIGWRMLFVLSACAGAVVFFVGLKVLGAGKTFPRSALDVPSLLLCAVGLVCLLYGLSSFASSPAPLIAVLLALVGAVVLAVFIVRQLHMSAPLLDVRVFRVGRYRTSVIVAGLSISISMPLAVMLPLYIENLLGFSPLAVGLTMLPGAIAGGVAGLFAGRLFDRRGIRVCAVPGTCLIVVGMLMLCTFGEATPLVAVGVAYLIAFLGIQLLNTTIATWGCNALPDVVLPHGQAAGNTLNQVSCRFR